MQKKPSYSLADLELKYDTQSITVNGECVWPVLRLKINEEIRKKNGLKSRTVKLNISVVLQLIGTLFYGLFDFFRIGRFKFWFFSSSDRRKKLDSKYVDRVIGSLAVKNKVSLVIENPYPKGGHYKRKEVDVEAILSQTIFFAIIKLFYIFGPKTPKINNEELITTILDENEIHLNYRKLIRNYISQYRFMKFLLRFAKPQAVFFVYAASSMGYIKALKEKKIHVIEIQHGVINKSHNAYNLNKNYGRQLLPDYLLTFGQLEKKLFSDNNHFIDSEKVFPVGYYFLDQLVNASSHSATSQEVKKGYETIVVFSLQDPFEDFIFEFIIEAARLSPQVFYMLVPRDPEKPYSGIAEIENLRIERNLNVYECLSIADVHATINSTCALEAPCFGVPNILYDYKGWAYDYYSSVLDDQGITVYTSTAAAFVESLNTNTFYGPKEIREKSRQFFEPDFSENVRKVLSKEILKSGNAE